jgi:hypothetical protein
MRQTKRLGDTPGAFAQLFLEAALVERRLVISNMMIHFAIDHS